MLNLIERFFGELTERQLLRLAVTSVGELTEHITRIGGGTTTTTYVWEKLGRAAPSSHWSGPCRTEAR